MPTCHFVWLIRGVQIRGGFALISKKTAVARREFCFVGKIERHHREYVTDGAPNTANAIAYHPPHPPRSPQQETVTVRARIDTSKKRCFLF